MKRILPIAVLLAALIGLAVPLPAVENQPLSKNEQRAARVEAKQARKAKKAAIKESRKATTSALSVSGEELKANLEKLEKQLKWHDGAESALKTANKVNKPVFLLNVLGERCGFV